MKKSIVALGIVLALSGCAAAADETLAAEPAALVEISPATEETAWPVEAAATAEPAQTATPAPTPEPTQAPTPAPTAEPTAVPTAEPTQAPVEETVAATPYELWCGAIRPCSRYGAMVEHRQQRQRILGRAGEHQRHPCGGGTFPAGNGRRAERGGRCPLRKFCRGRRVRPQRHDHPQRNLRSRSYRLSQQRMQLLAEQSCPLCQHHQRQLYEHGCGLLVLLHRRGAVYLLDCHLQLKLLLVFIQKL